jgi:hypothetical protein
MTLSEAEGLLRIAAADLETAVASTNPISYNQRARELLDHVFERLRRPPHSLQN